MAAQKQDPHINPYYFKQHLESIGKSQRWFAERLRLPESSLTRVLQGKRRVQLEEARLMANVLGAPLDEVLQNCGMDLETTKKSKEGVKVAGWIDSDMMIHTKGLKGHQEVLFPGQSTKGLEALRFHTSGTKMEGMDGALVLYKPTSLVNPDALGRLAVVKPSGEESPRLAIVKRGYAAGSYNLTKMDGETIAVNVMLESATPVLWLKM